jgi:hypothetical protein
VVPWSPTGRLWESGQPTHTRVGRKSPRRTKVPRGVLRAHGVTPAHHFLHVRAKTSGASSCLSEPPEGASPALASQMTSGERPKDRPLRGTSEQTSAGRRSDRLSHAAQARRAVRMALPNRRHRPGCPPPSSSHSFGSCECGKLARKFFCFPAAPTLNSKQDASSLTPAPRAPEGPRSLGWSSPGSWGDTGLPFPPCSG